MNDYLIAVALAAMPALGNFTGGMIAEITTVSKRMLSLALHAAAGIVVAVVGVELMPRVIQAKPPWVIVAAFLLGGAVAVVVDVVIDRLQERSGGSGDTGPWMIYFGVATDLFSDGLMIGAGSTISFGLGLILALGQVSADLPEGFATIASFKSTEMSRLRRVTLSASFALPTLLGATVGYWLVRGRPELLKLTLLSFTAAILTAAAVEDMITQAHQKEEDTRLQEFVFIAGFALFTLLSIYLN